MVMGYAGLEPKTAAIDNGVISAVTVREGETKRVIHSDAKRCLKASCAVPDVNDEVVETDDVAVVEAGGGAEAGGDFDAAHGGAILALGVCQHDVLEDEDVVAVVEEGLGEDAGVAHVDEDVVVDAGVVAPRHLDGVLVLTASVIGGSTVEDVVVDVVAVGPGDEVAAEARAVARAARGEEVVMVDGDAAIAFGGRRVVGGDEVFTGVLLLEEVAVADDVEVGVVVAPDGIAVAAVDTLQRDGCHAAAALVVAEVEVGEDEVPIRAAAYEAGDDDVAAATGDEVVVGHGEGDGTVVAGVLADLEEGLRVGCRAGRDGRVGADGVGLAAVAAAYVDGVAAACTRDGGDGVPRIDPRCAVVESAGCVVHIPGGGGLRGEQGQEEDESWKPHAAMISTFWWPHALLEPRSTWSATEAPVEAL